MKVAIRVRKRLQAGRGIAIAHADANTIISATAAEVGAGSSYAEGAAVEVIQGSDSKLVKVVTHSTATTPSVFPAIVKVVNSSQIKTLDANGLVITSGSSHNVQVNENAVQLVFGTGAGVTLAKNEGLHVYNSAFDCYIATAAVTKNMSIREIDICDAGVTKKMLVLASAPY